MRCIIGMSGIMSSRSGRDMWRTNVALVCAADRLQKQKEQRKERDPCTPQFRFPPHCQCTLHGLHRSLRRICASQPECA
jgi:hypothetical protein